MVFILELVKGILLVKQATEGRKLLKKKNNGAILGDSLVDINSIILY